MKWSVMKRSFKADTICSMLRVFTEVTEETPFVQTTILLAVNDFRALVACIKFQKKRFVFQVEIRDHSLKRNFISLLRRSNDISEVVEY